MDFREMTWREIERAYLDDVDGHVQDIIEESNEILEQISLARNHADQCRWTFITYQAKLTLLCSENADEWQIFGQSLDPEQISDPFSFMAYAAHERDICEALQRAHDDT